MTTATSGNIVHSTSLSRQHSQASPSTSELNSQFKDQPRLRPADKEALDFNAQGSFHTTDGRVRNPVPHKLQGMADDKNGNFAVMHIDLASAEMSERNAAAKRTSEGTEAAARLANMSGYQAVKRNKLAWPPPEQGVGLSAHDTKTEQARLLTLLRSVHPVAVVDQLCKALAYFGGIPGAPAPNDVTNFPTSATVNGPGSLFVGWIGEIFPAVGNSENAAIAPVSDSAGAAATPAQPGTRPLQPQPQSTPKQAQPLPLAHHTPHSSQQQHQQTPTSQAQDATRQAPVSTPTKLPEGMPSDTPPVKRGRGRPKGSKGIKKRELEAAMAASGQLVDGQPLSSSDANARGWSAQPATQNPESSPALTASGKKRGRPKGSKNKPKNLQQAGPGDTSQDSDQSVNVPTADMNGSPMATTGQFPFTGSTAGTVGNTNMARTSMGPAGYVVSGNWSGPASHNTQDVTTPAGNTTTPNPRKRKGQKPSEDKSAPSSANVSFSNSQAQSTPQGHNVNNAKKRRTSKEAHPSPAFNTINSQQANRVGNSGSPAQHQGISQNTGSPATFGTPQMANRQHMPQHHHQHQPQPQPHQSQHQQFQSPQPAQARSPHVAAAHNNQAQKAMVNARSGSQMPYAQAGMNMTAQELYVHQQQQQQQQQQQHHHHHHQQQQQQQNYAARMTQSNSGSSSFDKANTGKSPVFQQNINRPGSMDANMAAAAAAAANVGQAPGNQHQAAQLAREAANRTPHGFDNRQTPAGLQPSYGDQQAYMTMDYSGLGDRNMHGASFNASPAQLNATMSDMRSRMQRSQGR